MNLRRLRYFVVLAEELHFGNAARKLHIAQPALTQNLRHLEDELGLPLLLRTSRRVALTEAGQALLPDARSLLAQADALHQRMQAMAAGEAGTLRINYSRSAPGGRSSAIVQRFRAAHPAVRLEINSQFTARSVEEVLADQVDAAFVRLPVTADGSPIRGLQELALDTEPLVVGLPQKHRLARRRRLTPEDLREEPLVTGSPERAPGFYRELFRQVWPVGSPRIVLREPDEEHMLRAVAAGTGITILTQSRAATIQIPGVVIKTFAEPQPQTALGLLWKKGNRSRALAAFLAIAEGD